jgi:hypothetical protein
VELQITKGENILKAHVDEGTLRDVMPMLARRDVPLLVHAELPSWLCEHRGRVERYRDYEATRPADAERAAINLMATLARRTGARVHIVHVSSAAGTDAADIAAPLADDNGIDSGTVTIGLGTAREDRCSAQPQEALRPLQPGRCEDGE